MMTALSIASYLLFCITVVLAVDTFPDKLALGPTGSSVTLSCHTSELPVTWQLNSEEVEPSELTVLDGKKLIIHDLQEDQMGNYTCWSKGKVVDYTYILLDESSKFTDSSITCTAETFNCTYKISCRMDQAGFNVFRLRNQRDDSGWVQRSSDGAFHLTHTTNPYAEEAEQLVVTGEAASSSGRYFKITHSFYLRDIIKPASPGIDVSNSKVFLKPPATWSQPLSYYPLEHEIQCMRRDDGKETFCELDNNKVPKGMSKLRVRCRDSLLLSQWSDWTPWQNVRKNRKRKEKTKNGTYRRSHSKNAKSPL